MIGNKRVLAFIGTRKIWQIVLVCILLMAAIASIGHIWYKNYVDHRFDGKVWGVDFYQFWYGGQFLWQGQEPYSAVMRGEKPRVTAINASSATATPQIGEPLPMKWDISYIPGSAPLFLLLAPLSLIPWVSASILWGAINTLLGFIYVWILLHLNGESLTSLRGVALLAVFLCLLATRQVLELGQTSLIIVTLMFAALLVIEQSPVVSGIFLGIALSKFTLAFPMIVYFLYRQQYKALLICVATQIGGLLAIVLFTHSNLFLVAQTNLIMGWNIVTTQQTAGFATHLFALGWGMVAYIVAIIMTLMAVIGIIVWFRSRPMLRMDDLSGQTLISIASFWGLLLIYHAWHDWVVGMLFVVILALRSKTQKKSHLSSFLLTGQQTIVLYVLTIAVLSVWILPLYTLIGEVNYRSLFAVCTIIVFVLSLGLLFTIQNPTTRTSDRQPAGHPQVQ